MGFGTYYRQAILKFYIMSCLSLAFGLLWQFTQAVSRANTGVYSRLPELFFGESRFRDFPGLLASLVPIKVMDCLSSSSCRWMRLSRERISLDLAHQVLSLEISSRHLKRLPLNDSL